MRIPASRVTVRSPASCSRTRSSPRVERMTSPPSRSIEMVRPARLAAARTPAASATVCGTSAALGKTGLLERMGAVGAGHLTAEAWGREDLAGIRDSLRVERLAQPAHRLEVVRPEHLRHRARLVDADPVL